LVRNAGKSVVCTPDVTKKKLIGTVAAAYAKEASSIGIGSILGHSSVTMTAAVYSHRLMGRDREAAVRPKETNN
jgi:integrase